MDETNGCVIAVDLRVFVTLAVDHTESGQHNQPQLVISYILGPDSI